MPLPSSAADQLRVEEARPLDGPLLGLDDGEAAELGAGAGHHAPLEGAGERRVLLHERLGQQVVEPVLGDAGEDEVLVGADAHGAVAVGLGQPRHLDQLDPVHAPDRHRAAHVEQARLLLGVDADVVAPVAPWSAPRPAGASAKLVRSASAARNPSGPSSWTR